MQYLEIELHEVTAVTAVAVVMIVVATVLYLVIEINESRKMILQGEN